MHRISFLEEKRNRFRVLLEHHAHTVVQLHHATLLFKSIAAGRDACTTIQHLRVYSASFPEKIVLQNNSHFLFNNDVCVFVILVNVVVRVVPSSS